MAHVNFAVLAFETEVMRATAIAVTVSAVTTMVAVANTIALVDAVTLLAAPITFVV